MSGTTWMIDGEASKIRCAVTLSLAAAEILDLEICSVVRRLLANGRLTARRADQAIADLVDLRVPRAAHRPLGRRCWELRRNLSPYDASCVALAEALDTSLLTADERLAHAPGHDCPIELISTTRRQQHTSGSGPVLGITGHVRREPGAVICETARDSARLGTAVVAASVCRCLPTVTPSGAPPRGARRDRQGRHRVRSARRR